MSTPEQREGLNWSQRITMRMIADGRSPAGGSSFLDTTGRGIPEAPAIAPTARPHRALLVVRAGMGAHEAGVDAIRSGACEEPDEA